ncbi:hypothetical protein ANCDUO_10690 [Ancylostoma duodenale]|uniref:Phlebovirus glycoprotein G2 fusion domain-containing protein n=1 Tax=Ancylostoma duodenale TaxID=51022 RepID=A0A0C2GJN6_9BILA|nr:hypothetical protein ANCDUO_10690 [Ancylostoma duodenale]
MGRIQELVPNSEGIVREAMIVLPSRRQIRRPVNLLVPTELDDGQHCNSRKDESLSRDKSTTSGNIPAIPTEGECDVERSINNGQRTSRYNLRPRRQMTNIPLILTVLLTMVVMGESSQTASSIPSLHLGNHSQTRSIRCIEGGVDLISTKQAPYEVCAEEFCRIYDTPQVKETVRFPSQVVLHEHRVQWRFINDESVNTIETTCPPAPFCEHIDCTFCSAVIFNPECWPFKAILATTVLLYFVITGCYVFLYVPLTLGTLLRILTSFVWGCIRRLIMSMARVLRRRTRDRQRPVDLVELFMILRNETSLHEIRIHWKSLALICEPETSLFTRDTAYHVVDSKRCPHTGSCKGKKCASIHSTSLLLELERGKKYPETTACVESCGGPGCDCFYWSSGCLFYRIYLTPTSSQVYEIFHCTRWSEAEKVEIKHFDAIQGKTRTYIAHMRPNIPVVWNSFTFTLSSVTVPPTPLLNTHFITDGNNTAIWDSHMIPPLQCPNKFAAETLNCTVVEDCTCYPAETQVNCKYREANISAWFNNENLSLKWCRHYIFVVTLANKKLE